MTKKIFKGRPLLAGDLEGPALVSHAGFNTMSTYKRTMMGGQTDKVICADQDNKDLFEKDLDGVILCLPQTIGSTTGGFVLMGVAKLDLQPKAMLFANHIDSLAAGGLLMADIWMDKRIITIDMLGQEFLDTVKTDDTVKIHADGTVEVG